MNIFKKIYKSYKKSSTERQINEQEVNLSLDDSFVHNFISKGGRFLYCTSISEVASNLKEILKENNWNEITCSDFDLLKITDKLDINIQKKNF
jgi:hypothetical protein